MTNREELKVALAQAEASRKDLEARLVAAKAALVNTVTDASKIDANRAEAEAKVEKARARCRQLRAALADPSHLEFITRSHERLGDLFEQSDGLSEGESIAKSSSVQGRDLAPPAKKAGAGVELSWRKPFQRFGDALAASPHVRETIGLLALILAYLQYYFLDVEFQIISLPSAITLLAQ